MPESRGHVVGQRDQHDVKFYGLSTCVWCRRTRSMLEEQDVAFDYVYVDLLQGAEREAEIECVRSWNPAVSFPTLLVDDDVCVVGYKPDEIERALGL